MVIKDEGSCCVACKEDCHDHDAIESEKIISGMDVASNRDTISNKNTSGESDANHSCSCKACESASLSSASLSSASNSSDSNAKNKLKSEYYQIAFSITLFIIAILFEFEIFGSSATEISIIFYLVVYAVSGFHVFQRTIKNIAKGKIFDENFLMTIASIGAILTSNVAEAAGVMLFFKVGEIVEELNILRSKKSIRALLDVKPKYANIITDNCVKQIEPDQVQIGDILLVKPGEKVPIDGVVVEGESFFDTSPLTGESVPQKIKLNEQVLAGYINSNTSVKMKAQKTYTNSSISKIMELVQNAEQNKARIDKFITKFAKYYTPLVVLAAFLIVIIPLLVIPGAIFNDWLYRGMIFLVISCPCALVLSIPLGYFGGIGGASKHGILVKGANFLDIMAKTETILFDKTGTITKGNFKVSEVVPLNGISHDRLLELTALAENFSNHPIAKSIIDAYQNHNGNGNKAKELDSNAVKNFKEVPAHGISVTLEMNQLKTDLMAGNDKILHKFDVKHEQNYCDINGTVVHVAIDGVYSGYLLIADEVKPTAKKMVEDLHKLGINHLSLVSGDQQCIVEGVANQLGFQSFVGGLLPEQKVIRLHEMKNKHGTVAFIGDGINDAPVIANSDVGIAMGALGSDVAIETADIVLLNESLDRIPLLIRIARKTRRIVWQNIIIVFLIKALFLTLGAFGLATMWEAVFADVGVAALAILNASRALRIKNN